MIKQFSASNIKNNINIFIVLNSINDVSSDKGSFFLFGGPAALNSAGETLYHMGRVLSRENLHKFSNESDPGIVHYGENIFYSLHKNLLLFCA